MNAVQDTSFVFVIDGSSYKPMYEKILSDVKDREDVTVLTDEPNPSLRKALLKKRKVCRLFRGKLDFLGYEENVLYHALEDICPRSKQVIVVFFNAALKYNSYVAGTLRRYKKRWPNLRYVAYYLDIVDVHVSFDANYLAREGVFDLRYTVDKADAEKYGMHHIHTRYSADPEYVAIEPQIGLYFCGVTKNRQQILAAVAEGCRENGIPLRTDLICYEPVPELEKYKPEVNLLAPGMFLSYDQVLANELSGRCILEIVQKNQAALTLRAYEAVVYNRKLLTNNKSILAFEYYDPAYIQYFENAEDIDWQWVKDQTPVDYGYRGDFSAARLLEDIKSRLDKT